jgi:hypothetical protein
MTKHCVAHQSTTHQSTDSCVCTVCLIIASNYYKAVDYVKTMIHDEYRVKFDKYFNLFSTFNRKVKADWILAYLRTADYENSYHSEELDNYIAELLDFHNMKVLYLKETDENLVTIDGKRYFGHMHER